MDTLETAEQFVLRKSLFYRSLPFAVTGSPQWRNKHLQLLLGGTSPMLCPVCPIVSLDAEGFADFRWNDDAATESDMCGNTSHFVRKTP